MKRHIPLDEEFPPGDPESRFCRWCEGLKRRIGDGLGCVTCDAVKDWPNAEENR